MPWEELRPQPNCPRRLSPANNHTIELRSRSFPGQPSDETTARANILIVARDMLKQRAQLHCAWIPDPPDCERRNVYYLELLSFGVICYMAVDN